MLIALNTSKMTKKHPFVAVIAFMLLSMSGFAQNKFSNCSAIFLNQKLVVDDYSPNGKCLLQTTATGELTVCTAVFENDKWRAVDKIPFKITIRDGETKTLLSYSNKTYKNIDINAVLSKCRKGDYILISVLKDDYALPHNEILVQ